MRRWASSLAALGLVALAPGCNVTAQNADTEGIALEGDAGASPDAAAPPGLAPQTRGFLAVNSDYQSVSLSVVSIDGEVLSRSIISSESSSVGLSAPLSSDLVLTNTAPPGSETVLIDRTQAVLSWLDLESGDVRAQLEVGTGFAANPHDYVELSEKKAYVARWEANADSGQVDFDAGDDLLIIDPTKAKVLGRVDLSSALEDEDEDQNYLVRPERFALLGEQVVLSVGGVDATFANYADGRLLRLDTERDELAQVLVFAGLKNCTTLAAAPSGDVLALTCSGVWGQDPADEYPDAGIVVVGLDGEELVELDRMTAATLGGAQPNGVAWISDSHLIFSTFGAYDEDYAQEVPDTVRIWDVSKGMLVGGPLLESAATPFSLGDLACATQGYVCAASDAETDGGVLHYFEFGKDGKVDAHEALELDTGHGLPPRYLGRY